MNKLVTIHMYIVPNMAIYENLKSANKMWFFLQGKMSLVRNFKQTGDEELL